MISIQRTVLFRASLSIFSSSRVLVRKFSQDDGPEPEYATLDLEGHDTYSHKGVFHLSNGGKLKNISIAYETWGALNYRKNNAILLHCGMSASSHAASNQENESPGWWQNFIGPGLALDTNLFYVICTNNLGGCYGSTGPSSINSETNKPYGSTFPLISVQDMVDAQFLLMDHLKIDTLFASVGSSLGGMQSVCAAANYPDRVQKFISISACAQTYPGSIAFRYTQRKAVMSDPNWNGGDYYDGPLPSSGLKLAREIGTITYRSGHEWQVRFGRKEASKKMETVKDHTFAIEEYLNHQGKKWINQYDPNSMICISKAMDAFTLAKKDEHGVNSLAEGLKPAKQPALVIGIQTDVLFPCWQQKEIADSLKAAGNKHVAYYELDTMFGHDTFLLDVTSIGAAIKGHLEQEPFGAKRLWNDVGAIAAHVVAKLANQDLSDETLRQLFKAMDTQNEGHVEIQHVSSMLKFIWADKFSDSEIDFASKSLDANHDERVDLREFLNIRNYLSLETSYTAI